KTGTLTKNELSLAEVAPLDPWSETEVLRLALLASKEATQDPIDLAILAGAQSKGVDPGDFSVLNFTPFDPSTKCSEAQVLGAGGTMRIVKGAPPVVARMAGLVSLPQADRLAEQGYRVLAVAAGAGELKVAGLLALLDPPREDSASLIEDLRSLGIRVLMITGDGLATAKSVAARVGIGGRAGTAETLRADPAAAAHDCDVFAGVLPEDKYQLVRALQRAGHVTGMTGDGVNDAPALKQAEVGVAVSNATDVAKAAASIVLTNPGLRDVIAAVETSRRIYQRMLTYTLNKIIKTIEISLFLSLGVILLHTLVVTPLLIVLLLFTNDFVTMSIATDNVSFSKAPESWRIRSLVMTAVPLAAMLVLFSLGVLLFGMKILGLGTGQIQTLSFLILVFGGQGTVYLVRERGHFWRSAPSGWMTLATSADFAVVGVMAWRGILMAPLEPAAIAGLLVTVGIYLILADFVKIAVFRRFGTA
ncbi:MAG: HAD-IC family P-type ATPase, partial [Acidobacteriota bacterium]|nr:HAD-IC family P-type ATPase [Acidobacteriota bacterium]